MKGNTPEPTDSIAPRTPPTGSELPEAVAPRTPPTGAELCEAAPDLLADEDDDDATPCAEAPGVELESWEPAVEPADVFDVFDVLLVPPAELVPPVELFPPVFVVPVLLVPAEDVPACELQDAVE